MRNFECLKLDKRLKELLTLTYLKYPLMFFIINFLNLSDQKYPNKTFQSKRVVEEYAITPLFVQGNDLNINFIEI